MAPSAIAGTMPRLSIGWSTHRRSSRLASSRCSPDSVPTRTSWPVLQRSQGRTIHFPPAQSRGRGSGIRVVGQATVNGRFADVNHARSLAYLHANLAARLVHFKIRELDGATIRITAPRQFTQEVSSHIYTLADAEGQPRFAGIAYRSRFGDNYLNWAVFERPQGQDIFRDRRVSEIGAGAHELGAALDLLGLQLQP